MRIRWAGVLWVLAASCRPPTPLEVDTSASKFIPFDVAVERLKEDLATAETTTCTVPRASLGRLEIKEWTIDERGLEARAVGKPPIRVDFKDVTATRLDGVTLGFQVRIFTSFRPGPDVDYLSFSWTSEAPARRALELFDALWRKP